jgi:hypothetical protein
MRLSSTSARTLAVIVLALSLVSPAPVRAEAALKYTQSGNKMHWTKTSLGVCVDEAASTIPRIFPYLRMAMDVWAEVPGVPQFHLADSDCDVNVTYKDFICCGNIRPLAINVLTHYQNGQIVRATITVNAFYAGRAGDASHDENIYDLPGGLAHELGHAIGLEEDLEDRTSVMFDTNFLGQTYKRKLKKGDLAAVNKLYPWTG